jgi:AraC-like DNA-binding protein
MVADELVKALMRYTNAFPKQNAVMTETRNGVIAVMRADHEGRPKQPTHATWTPALCFVAQGTKATVFGDKKVFYRAGQALIVSVEMPGSGWVVEASPKAPFLGIALELDLAMLRDVYERLDERPTTGERPRQSVLVTDFDGPLTDCVVRIVRLLDMPRALNVIYPAITREISYWLLAGPHGRDIAGMTLASHRSEPIVRAIVALRDRFDKPVRVEELASIAHLSPSAFHRQFKALTSMTPLQYQKQVRLLEARRLMVAEAVSAATAAFRVGYESASQFSREYARMFGQPPRRDVTLLARRAE